MSDEKLYLDAKTSTQSVSVEIEGKNVSFLPIAEFAELKGIDETEIVNRIRNGLYRGMQIDNKWYVNLKEFDRPEGNYHGSRYPRTNRGRSDGTKGTAPNIPKPVTYKILLDSKEHTLDIVEVSQWVADKRIKPDTQIYNNETKCWISFQGYETLVKFINTLPTNTKTRITSPKDNYSINNINSKSSTTNSGLQPNNNSSAPAKDFCEPKDKPSDPNSSYEELQTKGASNAEVGYQPLAFSWKTMLWAFLVALIINGSYAAYTGDNRPKNMFWTGCWVYLTLRAWPLWSWKALIPYPLFIALSTIIIRVVLIIAGTDENVLKLYISTRILCLVGGLAIFCYLLSRYRSIDGSNKEAHP